MTARWISRFVLAFLTVALALVLLPRPAAIDLAARAPECPEGTNREGCACDIVGVNASCWPGDPAERDAGGCRDGMTICTRTPAGAVWGPCQGFVLPERARFRSEARIPATSSAGTPGS